MRLKGIILLTLISLLAYSCEEKKYKVTYVVRIPPNLSGKVLVKYYDSEGGKIVYIEENWEMEVWLTKKHLASLFVAKFENIPSKKLHLIDPFI